MPDYEEKNWETGDTFRAGDATEMSAELEEQEQHDTVQDADIAANEAVDTAQAADIAALEAEVNQVFQEWVGTTGSSGTSYDSLAIPIPLDANGNRPIGVIVTQVAPGNGGGSGARGAAGNVRCGGGGASSAPQCREYFIKILPGDVNYRVNIVRAGIGGAAVTADNTPGNPGTSPGGSLSCQFRIDNRVFLRTWNNATNTPGQGGTIGASSGTGTGGVGYAGGALSSVAGASASTTGGVGGNGASSTSGQGPSSGAGGGITAANVANNGGQGGFSYNHSPNVGTSPAGGTVGGAGPTPGELLAGGLVGNSAGGGAASTTGAAQAGADGVGYGTGGGGGGASANGNPSGKGGDGGPGYVSARWVYA